MAGDLEELRKLFPAATRYTYLNHASIGPLSTPAAETMADFIAQRQGWKDRAHDVWMKRVEEVRILCARLLQASADEIAFVGSTSHGLNIVAAGLPWQHGDNVVCAETEFPANVYPWLNLRRKQVEVRFAKQTAGRIRPEAIAAQMDDHTRLVAISFVEFFTGYRNNLTAISDLCRQYDARLCVDGIQGLGVLPLSVQECGIDFLAVHAPKWLLGPIGAGFLYCRSDRLPELDLVMGGWRGIVDQEEYFKYDSEWLPSARRFETGSVNYVGITGMGASLQLLLDVGIARIEQRIRELTDHLLDCLSHRGYDIRTPRAHWRERSGIVSFVPPEQDPKELCDGLMQRGILVSARGPCIRVSPHFYNTEEEIDRLMGVLDEA